MSYLTKSQVLSQVLDSVVVMKLCEQNNNTKAIWQIVHLKLDLESNIFIRKVLEGSDVGTY